MRCFLDSNRTCDQKIQTNEGPRCRAWNVETEECRFIEWVGQETFKDGTMTITTFPPSAPPPEVK